MLHIPSVFGRSSGILKLGTNDLQEHHGQRNGMGMVNIIIQSLKYFPNSFCEAVIAAWQAKTFYIIGSFWRVAGENREGEMSTKARTDNNWCAIHMPFVCCPFRVLVVSDFFVYPCLLSLSKPPLLLERHHMPRLVGILMYQIRISAERVCIQNVASRHHLEICVRNNNS